MTLSDLLDHVQATVAFLGSQVEAVSFDCACYTGLKSSGILVLAGIRDELDTLRITLHKLVERFEPVSAGLLLLGGRDRVDNHLDSSSNLMNTSMVYAP